MYERQKLEEAGYFLQCMVSSVDQRAVFQYNLSAFLSAARSVLQYTQAEAHKKSGGQQWYLAKVSDKPVLKFFKDKRDINIHAKPVTPSQHISVSFTDHIAISNSIRIEIRRKDGTVEVHEHEEEPPRAKQQEEASETKIRYVFGDWKGSEDVIALSHQYLTDLGNLVEEGLSNGIISG